MCTNSSPVTIFSLYANVYKHVYGDFTKDEKEHQDIICSERNGDRPSDMLYDYVVDPATSQPDRGDLWGVSTHGKNSPFGFSRVVTAGKCTLSALMDTVLCLTAIFTTLLVLSSVNEAILL